MADIPIVNKKELEAVYQKNEEKKLEAHCQDLNEISLSAFLPHGPMTIMNKLAFLFIRHFTG